MKKRKPVRYGTGIEKPEDIQLTPYYAVTEMWNQISGEPPISESRVTQICRNAEMKLYRALARDARKVFGK